jgi:hypothetical protein
MIRAEDIPDEVESAAWNASGDNMKAAIAAAINAWPGARIHKPSVPPRPPAPRAVLILPLPQETRDD